METQTATSKNMDDQTKAINDNFKREARGRALASAERINPVTTNYSQGVMGQTTTKPSSETILKDAEIIYEWLIKDLK